MTPARQAHRDVALAFLLAGVLGLGWTVRDWPALSAMVLPDTDDVVRLQQIRDWLAGQRFGDLAQHRLGFAPGVEMHWSRLPDLLPAAIVGLLAPWIGAAAATLLAVTIVPLLLFAGVLALVAAIARALGVSGATAAVVAALAYPATTLFVPGRIDHHGWQMLLLLIVARVAIGGGGILAGGVAGMASAASLAIGMETAPLLAIGGAAMVAPWVAGRAGAQARLTGYAAGLSAALALAAVALRTSGWSYPACDGFTLRSWSVAQAGATACLLLATVGAARAPGRGRAIAAASAALATVAALLVLAPACLHPYGAVDPFLARVWLANVAEAQPLLRAAPAEALGYAGTTVVGLIVTAAIAARRRERAWAALLALQVGVFALTLHQMRGAYAGALLAAPALAAMIAAARARGATALLPAWLLSAGLVYPLAARTPAGSPGAAATAGCGSPRSLAVLGALPPGTVVAPIDEGARVLAATPHRAIAAPYHRNAAGNLYAYRLFLGPIAPRRPPVGGPVYILWCGTPAEALGIRAPRGSLAAALAGDRAPGWLLPVARDGATRIYRWRLPAS